MKKFKILFLVSVLCSCISSGAGALYYDPDQQPDQHQNAVPQAVTVTVSKEFPANPHDMNWTPPVEDMVLTFRGPEGDFQTVTFPSPGYDCRVDHSAAILFPRVLTPDEYSVHVTWGSYRAKAFNSNLSSNEVRGISVLFTVDSERPLGCHLVPAL